MASLFYTMPIKEENKKRYPKNWKQISEDIRFNRAGNKCEICGLRNYSVGYRDEQGNFIPECGNIILDCYGDGLRYPSLEPLTYKEAKEHADFATDNDEFGNKYIVIVLTVAHLDHQPENCDYSNLKAMCQKCHNDYDRVHRNETIRTSKNAGQLSINWP